MRLRFRRLSIESHRRFSDKFIVTVSTKMDKMKEERRTGVMAIPERVRGGLGRGRWTAGGPEQRSAPELKSKGKTSVL